MLNTPPKPRRLQVAGVLLGSLVNALASAGCNDAGPIAPQSDRQPYAHPKVEEWRPLSGVRSVDVELPTVFAFRIQQGEDEGLRIRGERVTVTNVDTELRDGTLEVRHNLVLPPNVRPLAPLELVLTVSTLKSARVEGPGMVEGSGLEVERLLLRSAGAGEMSFTNLTAAELEVEVGGSEPTYASGQVVSQDVRLTASGEYRGGDLASSEARVRVSGGGSATVRARDRLVVTIVGSGSVYYIGDPIVESSITGSGSVIRIEG
jgi:hypothetical protein